MQTPAEQLEQLVQQNDAEKRIERHALVDALDAALLFHSGSPWDEPKAKRWFALTGRRMATTKALCDFLRECAKRAGLEPGPISKPRSET